MSTRKTPVTAFSLPVVVRDEINLLAVDLTGKTRTRISMAAVVAAAVKIAKAHEDELIAALTEKTKGTSE